MALFDRNHWHGLTEIATADISTILNDLSLESKPFILCTLHRQENTDDTNRLRNIIDALNELSKQYQIVLPAHPRTTKILEREGIQLDFNPISPVGYFDMIQLLKNCAFVITDSGGLQKEAFFFKKFCLTTRDETEWTELIENRVNVLVGANKELILTEAEKVKHTSANFNIDLYGNGKACKRVIKYLM